MPKSLGYNLPAPWFNSISTLLRVQDYGEAFALAEFFPATLERKLLQYLALLGQNKLTEAEALLAQIDINPQTVPVSFTILVRNLDLLTIADNAIKQLRFATAHFCIELYFLEHDRDLQRVIDKMLVLASGALMHDKIEIGFACFDRVVDLDESPTSVLQYAEVALASRSRNSTNDLFALAQSLIDRALPQVPVHDYESRLKAAKLLAIDVRTFDTACQLFRQILHASPSLTPRVFDTLLPLIEYKTYFGEIADFLLALAPQRAAQIANRLVRDGRKVQRNQTLLEKARTILDEIDDVQRVDEFQLAEAILNVGRHSEDFELYAQRLLTLTAAAAVFLETIKILLDRKSKDNGLIAGLLERLLLLHPNSRLEVISGYGRLSNLALANEQVDRSNGYLDRAIALSTGVQEFLERTVNMSLNHQLLFLIKHEGRISNAPWQRGQVDEGAVALITSANPHERKDALYNVLSKHNRLDTNRLTAWITAFFRSDLDLTGEDVRQILELLPSISSKVQKVITDGLATQEVRDRRRGGWLVSGMNSLAFDMPLRRSMLNDRLLLGLEKSLPLAARLAERERGTKKRPAVPVDRHTRIEFPNQCALEKKVDLLVQLTKAPPAKTRVRKKLKIDVAPQLKKIELEISVTAPTFAMQERRKRMSMSLNKDSETVTFSLVPLELGHHEIEVEFFYESFRVGYILVKTHVSRWPTTDSPSHVFIMETPSHVLKKAEKLQARLDRRILHATWFEKESKLSYTVYSSGVNESPEWETRGSDVQGEVRTYLQQLNEFLSQVVVQGNPNDVEWESTQLNLESIGASLFTTLLPSPLAMQARNWKDGSLIIVSTNEQWIPWELFHDGQDFWGKRFILARLPRLSDRRSVPDVSRRESRLRARQVRRVVNVVGGDVGVAEGEQASRLFSMLDSRIHVELLQEQPISTLDKALDKADVLHLTCHGHLDPYMLQVSKDNSMPTNLLPQTVQKLPLEPGSFVFANTCTAAVPVLTFGKFSSFAWEFYKRGAGAFVGTLGEVPTTHAISFAESIYRELFSKKRKTTVGQAVNLAKSVVARERNLFWLLYCIYGDPDYVLRVSNKRRA